MTHPTGSIVVGVDDSTSAQQALAWATDQAVLERRPLVLVHALGSPNPAWSDVALASPQAVFAAMRKDGREVLERARRVVRDKAPDLEVHELLEFVDARDLLLEQTKSAAMVVVGSRGRGPVRSMLLGSVGVSLAHRTSCPVVIHRPWHPGAVRHGVLAACDATAESRDVLEHAFHQAELRRLPLTVMHCYWDVQSYATGTFPADRTTADLETERLDLAEAMAGLGEKYPDVGVTTTMVHGMPEAQVVAAAEQMDLVVVGAHRGSWANRMMFGSVSTAVVEHAHAPVAVVPVGVATTTP